MRGAADPGPVFVREAARRGDRTVQRQHNPADPQHLGVRTDLCAPPAADDSATHRRTRTDTGVSDGGRLPCVQGRR